MHSNAQGDIADVAAAPRSGRRLADRVLIAVHAACDQGELAVAEQLLRVLETFLTRPPQAAEGNRRRLMEAVVAAHERLWHLRHPDVGRP